MPLYLDPHYIRTRLERCRDLAERSTTPALREVHVAHMRHYQWMLDNTESGVRGFTS